MFEIAYDFGDMCSTSEVFEGDRTELNSYLKELRSQGCHHISALPLSPERAESEAERLMVKVVALNEYARRKRAEEKTIKP